MSAPQKPETTLEYDGYERMLTLSKSAQPERRAEGQTWLSFWQQLARQFYTSVERAREVYPDEN